MCSLSPVNLSCRPTWDYLGNTICLDIHSGNILVTHFVYVVFLTSCHIYPNHSIDLLTEGLVEWEKTLGNLHVWADYMYIFIKRIRICLGPELWSTEVNHFTTVSNLTLHLDWFCSNIADLQKKKLVSLKKLLWLFKKAKMPFGEVGLGVTWFT